MKNEELEKKISQYVDGELPDEEKSELLRYLDISDYAKGYLKKQQKLKSALGELMPDSLTDEKFNEYWPNISSKLSKGIGWLLLILGVAANILHALYIYFTSPIEPFDKIVSFCIISGLMLLFISVAHQRWKELKTDKYKDVMK